MNRRAYLLQAQEAIQRELKELEEREKIEAYLEKKRNFDGYVYVQCTFVHKGNSCENGGAGIRIYYTREEADPKFPVVKIKVGGDFEFVPFEDKELSEGVH